MKFQFYRVSYLSLIKTYFFKRYIWWRELLKSNVFIQALARNISIFIQMYKTLLLETQTTAQTENLEWMYRVAKFCNKKHNHIYKSSMCGSIFSHLPSLSLMNKFEAVFFKWRCHHRLISYSTGKYVIMHTKITIPPSVFTKQFNRWFDHLFSLIH